MGPDQIVQGNGRTRWRVHDLGWVITIPDGMRLRGGYGWVSESGSDGVSLYDVESGSGISFNVWGRELGRTIRTPAQSDQVQNAPLRDVGALFDQIVISLVRSP